MVAERKSESPTWRWVAISALGIIGAILITVGPIMWTALDGAIKDHEDRPWHPEAGVHIEKLNETVLRLADSMEKIEKSSTEQTVELRLLREGIQRLKKNGD